MLRFPSSDPGPVSQPEDRRKLGTRLIIVQAGVTVIFAALALAFWYFQVVQHQKFREMAENNHQRTLPLRAPRGVLFDRNGKVLVENRDSFVISIVREQSKNIDQTIRLLARVTGVDERIVREIVRRRWPRVPHHGFLLVFIASRASLTAPHQEMATEIESLLAHAGALAPAIVA